MSKMIKKKINLIQTAILILSSILFQCSDELVTPLDVTADTTLNAAATTSIAALATCSTCTYVVPATAGIVDGAALGLKPGDVVCFSAAIQYTKSITLKNLVGTATSPITVTNCGGTVNLTVVDRPYNLKVSNSKYLRITGGATDNTYGIRITGSTGNGLVLCDFSTHFEVDHIEVYKVGFAGIMAKTDPTCDDATIRGNFTMRTVSFHDNYIHESKGEGFYVGHSYYAGYTTDCGVRLPHLIDGVKIYKNIVKNAGWDGIQLSCASTGALVYSNTVENSGTLNNPDQNAGIIIGGGTGGACYGNYVKGGSGPGMAIFGLADNLVHSNIIVNSGKMGIFCDERTDPGAGYRILNNTIINPGTEGMRIYAEKVTMNIVKNNIIVNPGSYATANTASYVMKLGSTVPLDMTNNYTTLQVADVKFVNADAFNYKLQSTSPAINTGFNIAAYKIAVDYFNTARLKGIAYDVGASEF